MMAHSLPDPGRKLQQDFAEAAVDLELDLVPAGAHPAEEVRSIGIMAKRGAPNAIVQLDLAPAPVAGDSDQAIQDLLTRWEQLLPEELEANFGDCTLDPYVAVGEWVVSVDLEQIQHWRAGEAHTQALAQRPALDQRKIELSYFHIVYAGTARAIVTYHVQESYPESTQVFSGNAGAILVHVAAGWRIASYTKAEQVGI
jgi:hypothetical protein